MHRVRRLTTQLRWPLRVRLPWGSNHDETHNTRKSVVAKCCVKSEQLIFPRIHLDRLTPRPCECVSCHPQGAVNQEWWRRTSFHRPRGRFATSSSLVVTRRFIQCVRPPNARRRAPALASCAVVAVSHTLARASADLSRLLRVLPGARSRSGAALCHARRVPHVRAAVGRRLRLRGRLEPRRLVRPLRRPTGLLTGHGSTFAWPRCSRGCRQLGSPHGTGVRRFCGTHAAVSRLGGAVGGASRATLARGCVASGRAGGPRGGGARAATACAWPATRRRITPGPRAPRRTRCGSSEVGLRRCDL